MSSLLESIEVVAAVLENRSVEGTFAGGAVLPLFVEPVVRAQLRPTLDVDVIVRARNYFEYQAKCQVLVDAGFVPGQMERDPLCRYRRQSLVVDLMPTPYKAIGTGNPWFTHGVETAVVQELPSGRSVRTVSAPVYLATKIAAFRGRGGDDYYSSKDFEDIVALVDGRAELSAECRSQRADLRRYLSHWAQSLLTLERVRDYVAGHVTRGSGDERWKLVIRRLQGLAALDPDAG